MQRAPVHGAHETDQVRTREVALLSGEGDESRVLSLGADFGVYLRDEFGPGTRLDAVGESPAGSVAVYESPQRLVGLPWLRIDKETLAVDRDVVVKGLLKVGEQGSVEEALKALRGEVAALRHLLGEARRPADAGAAPLCASDPAWTMRSRAPTIDSASTLELCYGDLVVGRWHATTPKDAASRGASAVPPPHAVAKSPSVLALPIANSRRRRVAAASRSSSSLDGDPPLARPDKNPAA